MGFLFRLCFWMGVAFVIMPPEERPGEALAGIPGEVNLEQRFADTVHSAWTLVSQISTACEDNPQLCAATAALAQTAADTGQALVSDVRFDLQALPAPRAKATTPIDAPLPDSSHDGRVGFGQGPAE